jgi:uncharacterized protein
MNEDIVRETMTKMCEYEGMTTSDISHFALVWNYACVIADMENLSEYSKYIISVSAVVHDISCPSLREEYGRADGKMQEESSRKLLENFFLDIPVASEDLEKIIDIVSHHHSPLYDGGIEHRVLIEADYIVNKSGCEITEEEIGEALESVFRTKAGAKLFLDKITD